MTKPTDSHSLTQWKLAEESEYFYQLEEKLDCPTELVGAIETLIQSKTNIPELANNILYYINESEALEDSISQQIAVLQHRKERYKKRAENLRASIKGVFERFDIKKLETPMGTISQSTRKASKLVVTDEGELLATCPQVYTRQDPKLNRIALKSLLENGEVIEGAHLEDTTTISIRK